MSDPTIAVFPVRPKNPDQPTGWRVGGPHPPAKSGPGRQSSPRTTCAALFCPLEAGVGAFTAQNSPAVSSLPRPDMTAVVRPPSSTTLFPPPTNQTGRADFPHPDFGRRIALECLGSTSEACPGLGRDFRSGRFWFPVPSPRTFASAIAGAASRRVGLLPTDGRVSTGSSPPAKKETVLPKESAG